MHDMIYMIYTHTHTHIYIYTYSLRYIISYDIGYPLSLGDVIFERQLKSFAVLVLFVEALSV